MFKKSTILFCSLLLIGSFSTELVFTITWSESMAIEIDADLDSEKEESKEENKQESIFFRTLTLTPKQERTFSKYIISTVANRWADPDLEMHSPPPRLG